MNFMFFVVLMSEKSIILVVNAKHSTMDVFEVVLGTCMFLWDGSAPDTSPDRALPRIPLGLSIFFAGSSAPPNPCQGSVPDPVLFEYCKKKSFFGFSLIS